MKVTGPVKITPEMISKLLEPVVEESMRKAIERSAKLATLLPKPAPRSRDWFRDASGEPGSATTEQAVYGKAYSIEPIMVSPEAFRAAQRVYDCECGYCCRCDEEG